jgi:hypothetical protein
MRKVDSYYNFKELKEAVKAFEELLESKVELDEKEDIIPFFDKYPLLILEAYLTYMLIDALEFRFQLWENLICDIAFGSSQKNTYCLIKLQGAKKNSIFSNSPENYPHFSNDFDNSYNQISDWLYNLDRNRNISSEIKHQFADTNPDISPILIIGRSTFLSDEDRRRFDWRRGQTVVNSHKIICFTYDELLIRFKRSLKEREIYFKQKVTPSV